MKDIPYFLMLIKNDLIIWTVISTGSFSNINLEGLDHVYWTSQYLQINNYSLSEDEKFNEVWITLTDISTTVSFRSNSSKYFDNTIYYFADDTIIDSSNPYFISDTLINNSSKELDSYDMGLDMPIDVIVGNSSSYGYYIDLTMYKKNWIDRVKNMKN